MVRREQVVSLPILLKIVSLRLALKQYVSVTNQGLCKCLLEVKGQSYRLVLETEHTVNQDYTQRHVHVPAATLPWCSSC